MEEEKYVVCVVRRVQNLVKSCAVLVLDVSNHWIGDDEEVRAYKFVIFVEVPKAHHSVPIAPHSSSCWVVLHIRILFSFGVHFDGDTRHWIDLIVEMGFFVKCFWIVLS